jgi:N-acetyl-anhydromuramyl-L-alanine amidase AmpD
MPLNIRDDILPGSLAWNGRSGNYSASGNNPSMLVMHATGGSTESARSWFRSRKSGVSSHYIIDKDGTIYRELPESAIAYTVGRSRWQGRTNLNDESISIELENADNYLDPYPKEQYNAAVELAKEIIARYHIQSENVVSHGEVAIPKGRKHDPAGFDMERFKYDVYSAPLDFGRWGQTTDPESPIGGAQGSGNVEAEPKKDDPTPLQSTSLWERFLSLFSGQNGSAGILSEFQRLLGLRKT